MADTTTNSTPTPVSTDASVSAAAVAQNPGQIAPIGSKAQTDAAAANAANVTPAAAPAKMADSVKPGDGTGKADQPAVTADVLKTIDEQNAQVTAGAGQSQAQANVDLENTLGYRGTATDPTPNENYTFGGQARGLGTPETHPEFAKAIGSMKFSHLGELDGTTADGNFDAAKVEADAKVRISKK